MKTYYTILEVIPCNTNNQYSVIEGGFANCWILENNAENAYRKAIFHIEKYDWQIKNIALYPLEVIRDKFIDTVIDLEHYDKAQEIGMSMYYLVSQKDGQAMSEISEPKPSYTLDIAEYLSVLQKEKNKGRCLHYDAGDRCTQFIKAHSIQNKGLLAQIAEDGHVYGLAPDFGSLNRNNGKLCYHKIGVNKISTFLGFCGKHDSELFEPIDTSPIIPSKQEQQIFLYAYRSLCREVFVKENSLNIQRNLLNKDIPNKAIKDFFMDRYQGISFGLKNLEIHKEEYDNSLSQEQYQDIQYVLFISKQKPTIVFSGVIYPDYDFIERQLQNLSDLNSTLELITFCSVSIEGGWGFLFAWHKSSSRICIEYMNSLKMAIIKKGSVQDFLFRLVIHSENLAISPFWWENLSDEDKSILIDTISNSVDPFVETPKSYLMNGIDGIVDWKFKDIRCNYE